MATATKPTGQDKNNNIKEGHGQTTAVFKGGWDVGGAPQHQWDHAEHSLTIMPHADGILTGVKKAQETWFYEKIGES